MADAVKTLVFSFVKIAILIDILKNFLDELYVARFCSPDKVVVGKTQFLPSFLPPRRKLLGVNIYILAGFVCSKNGFLRILISAGEEESVISQGPIKSSQDVRSKSGIGVANVRYIIYVIYGCGDEELFSFAHRALILQSCNLARKSSFKIQRLEKYISIKITIPTNSAPLIKFNKLNALAVTKPTTKMESKKPRRADRRKRPLNAGVGSTPRALW